uniref:Uncharacterized protein n=1 Tax=Arundo donax TaxID=35708 RepID=A0A0A8YM90_ARUDO
MGSVFLCLKWCPFPNSKRQWHQGRAGWSPTRCSEKQPTSLLSH